MQFKKVTYTPWWEDDIIESFEDEGEEVCLIIKQGIFMADALPYEDVSFPWHGRSLNDFKQLHIKMKKSLPEAMRCTSIQDVTRFKKKYPEVYKAYFYSPIQFLDDSPMVSDGRHRIYIAKLLNSVIPAWKVKYKRNHAFGEWRFFLYTK